MIKGLHHVTILASDPQKNLDFYAGVLGMRLVKKTVNFDAPHVYHLYYGNHNAEPGTIVTFFPWPGIRRGIRGPGQATTISLSIPRASLNFWMDRLEKNKVFFQKPFSRWDEEVISLQDPDGLRVDLVAGEEDVREGYAGNGVPDKYSIRGIHSMELTLSKTDDSLSTLGRVLGFRQVRESGNRIRMQAYTTPAMSENQGKVSAKPGSLIDVIKHPGNLRPSPGAGIVHHVAFRTDDIASQLRLHEKLEMKGMKVTDVKDRKYFSSIYFREPSGILLEVATDGPGFTVDEPADKLGTSLQLPDWEEPKRPEIEKQLSPLKLPDLNSYDA
ncbi:ring-cleaving dioxygenase [Roseivirga sp. BDSF3-8]|uniref:ring-cleaving dioxygenase n=1 Tax=Roseivirga sp. BDSF3-8 TaxID=3241598 RepID=UPI0035327F2B